MTAKLPSLTVFFPFLDDSAVIGGLLDRAAAAARVIRHPRNLGYGAAVRRGMAEAARDWVFYTDGDGQYDPAQLARLAALWQDDPTLDFVNGRKIGRADAAQRRVLGGGIGLELCRAAAAAGARFAEAPVEHFPRRHGRSKFFRPRGLFQLARDLAGVLID